MVYLITLIKNTMYKIFNFMFGKTKIFIIILGWFLVITGAMFLANPQRARNKLLGMGFGFFKWPLRIAALYVALVLLSFVSRFAGIFVVILAIPLLIGIIWLWRVSKKKAYDKLSAQFAKIPISALKTYAVIQIVVGALMLILQRRIW